MNGGAVMRTTLAVLPFALRLARGAEPGISFDPSGAPVKIDEHFWARVERTAKIGIHVVCRNVEWEDGRNLTVGARVQLRFVLSGGAKIFSYWLV